MITSKKLRPNESAKRATTGERSNASPPSLKGGITLLIGRIRGRYVTHEVVEHPQDPVRRVGGEPADQYPCDDEPEDDVVGVVNEADE